MSTVGLRGGVAEEIDRGKGGSSGVSVSWPTCRIDREFAWDLLQVWVSRRFQWPQRKPTSEC